ncbi:MAG: hypothetical protein LBE07_11605 [Gordonia sp. (in: high G+C Gram-positive bacteria)]|nr:hypothetical protein [Gordonia sp. (in: high G+C Gram-positive bacteria)]
MVTMVVVVGVVLWPRGHAETADHVGAVALEPMETAPRQVWKHSARDLFGPDAAADQLEVKADGHGVLVVAGRVLTPRPGSALIAVDAESGEALWDEPRIGESWNCAIGAGGVLACADNARVDGLVATRVDFFDLQTGVVRASQTIRYPGWPSITAVEDGFVVLVEGTANIGLLSEIDPDAKLTTSLVLANEFPDQQGRMVGYSSTGTERWAIDPPMNHLRLQQSAGTDMVALENQKGAGFSIYRADTGERVHTSSRGGDLYLLYEGGFVIGSGRYTLSSTVGFHDSAGLYEGGLKGWQLASYRSWSAATVDRDRVPVLLTERPAFGIVSADTKAVKRTVPGIADDVTQVDENHYLLSTGDLYAANGGYTKSWTIVDADSGKRSRAVSTGVGKTAVGFDGERLVLAGDGNADHAPNVPHLTAYDMRTGEAVWDSEPVDSNAIWRQFGRRLFLLQSTGNAFLSRYK